MRSLFIYCAILAAFAITASGQGKTSMQYAEEGSRHYLAGDFKKAIGPYQKAFDMEKQERKLSRDLWLVLVDNLGIAYGITGDIERSKVTLKYGIEKEPTYPMFYYNMACGYGETDDEENAIKYLRLAFKYKANMIKGERFPDPATDGSFVRLMESKTFRAAITEMKGGR